MASKCKQPNATKRVLAVAAQTVLQLEHLALFYTLTGATKDLELLLNGGLSANTRCRNMPGGPTLLHLAAGAGRTQIVLLLLRLGADKSIIAGVGGTPLHHAVLQGHVSTVKAMIKGGCSVDVVASNGTTVLHAAVVGGNAEVISAVLSTGCDINARSSDGVTPLHAAARKGNTETALELLRHGANKAIVAGPWGTPLHEAAGHGHVLTVKAMIKAGCPVDVVDSNGATVLHCAAEVSNAEVISVVLSTGCDINARSSDGVTPLHVAARKGNTETALELLRHGANKAIVAGLEGTPLHQAALCGHVSTVKRLLMAGCPVDVVGSNGVSVLHAAAVGGDVEVISELLTCTECEIDATDNDGATPLHMAAGYGKTEAALELIKHGANKAKVAGLGGTPLHQAAGCGHVSTVKRLLMAGCPVDVVASNDVSVLHAAAQGGSVEVIKELLTCTECEMINAADNDGRTPLHVAARSGKTEAALELIKHEANKAIVAGTMGTPLHQAAGLGHVSTVKAIIKAGCPVDVVGSNGVSVLHAAAQGGSVEVIKELLTCTECEINATDNDGGTPLHAAARSGKTEAALELINHGANKVKVAGLGGTPLHQAAFCGHVSTVKRLLMAGCPVDVVGSNDVSVLHAAAQGGSVEVIKELLTCTECEINAADNDGATPLHAAARSGKTEAALELIKHGANKAIVAGRRGTPLHQAAVHGHVSTVKAMIRSGCPVDVVDSDGATVLHYAAEDSNAEVIRELLSAGCDIASTDNDGCFPLNLAATYGNSEALQELIRCEMAQKGSVKSIHTDVHGWTPLHQAVLSQSKECVRILLEHGADPKKVSPYFGSSYHGAVIIAPAVVEEFDNFIVEEDESLPSMHVLRDPLCSIPKQSLRRSFLEKDTLGISHLEYTVILFQFPDAMVLLLHELSLVSRHNLLLLAAIHGLCKFLHNLTHGSAIHPSFTADTVTSLVNFNYRFAKVPQYHELVPPDATLNLLHVVLLSLKGRTSGEDRLKIIKGDHSSFLRLLVTSDSFRHTLHEYLPNGLTPLDLAEKLGLGDAVSIISSAGGRHGIYAMSSEEVRLQHGPTMLLAHQELMKLASSGRLGHQALQAVLSQLPGRTTVEQGTATHESYIGQQKVLDQRPKLNILSNYVVGNFNVERWRLLGTSLEVPQEVLSHISSTNFSCEDRYLEVLIYWLSHNEAANWRTLLEVLGHFETKNTLDKLMQKVLATQDSQVSGTWKMYSAVYQ